MSKATAPDYDFMTAPKAFVRVYRMPEKLTNGFCFGAAVPITFLNVDWFEAAIPAGREALIEYLNKKSYCQDGARLLIISDHPDFTFTLGELRS